MWRACCEPQPLMGVSILHGTGVPDRGQVSGVARGDHRRTGQVPSALGWRASVLTIGGGSCTDDPIGVVSFPVTHPLLGTGRDRTLSNSRSSGYPRQFGSASNAISCACSVIQSRASSAPSGLSHQSSGPLLRILRPLYGQVADPLRTKIVVVLWRPGDSHERSGSSVSKRSTDVRCHGLSKRR